MRNGDKFSEKIFEIRHQFNEHTPLSRLKSHKFNSFIQTNENATITIFNLNQSHIKIIRGIFSNKVFIKKYTP